MSKESIVEARRELTARELTRLVEELEQWEKKRRAADIHPDSKYRGQYESQLKAVVSEVRGSAESLREDVRKKAEGLSVGEFYDVFARHDRRILWIRRAWNYFRQKFDQRDDPILAPVLQAADEVVWSCYRPLFKNSGLQMDPAPLPYIDTNYSPVTFRSDQSSHLERPADADAGPLKDYFASLPVPVIQLPAIVVTAPWSLVLIGHEIGHIVQPSIEPGYAYVKSFRRLVEEAVHEAGADGTDEQTWGRWAPEIFADWFSVVTMGPWGAWVMGQFELSSGARMRQRRTLYPSAAARLVLLSRMSEQCGLGAVPDVLSDFEFDINKLEEGTELFKDVNIASRVAKLIYGEELPGELGNLRELVGFSADDYRLGAPPEDSGGEVAQWADALVGMRQKTNNEELRAARLVAAGAAQAWREILRAPAEDKRIEATDSLRRSAFVRIRACAEPGTRAAVPRAELKEQPGRRLSQILQEAGDDFLFQ